MKGTHPSTTTKRLVSACFTEVMGFYEHTSAWELAPHLGLAGGPNFRWQYNHESWVDFIVKLFEVHPRMKNKIRRAYKAGEKWDISQYC